MQTDHLDSRQLRYFLAVIEHGALRRAASTLGITEPALSKSIRQLEAALGVQLLERSARGMVPTGFGEVLAAHARLVRAEMTHALSEIAAMRGGQAGRIAVGCTPSFANLLLPRACAALLQRFPKVQIAVTDGLMDQLMPQLVSGALDLVVATLGAAPPHHLLEQKPFAKQDLAGVVARSTHPLARRRRLSLTALAGQGWVLTPDSDFLRGQLNARFAEAGLAPPVPSAEIGSILFLRSLLLEADLLAYLPLEVVRREIAEGQLVMLDVPAAVHRRTSGLLFRRRFQPPPVTAALMAELCALTAADQLSPSSASTQAARPNRPASPPIGPSNCRPSGNRSLASTGSVTAGQPSNEPGTTKAGLPVEARPGGAAPGAVTLTKASQRVASTAWAARAAARRSRSAT